MRDSGSVGVLYHVIVCISSCFDRSYLGGNTPGEWSGLLRLPPCSNLVVCGQKNFTVQYDTGSGDLFLPDSRCGPTCAEHTLYDPSASSTSKPLNKEFIFFRGFSYAIGTQYNDTVEIAGLTATSQTMASVRP